MAVDFPREQEIAKWLYGDSLGQAQHWLADPEILQTADFDKLREKIHGFVRKEIERTQKYFAGNNGRECRKSAERTVFLANYLLDCSGISWIKVAEFLDQLNRSDPKPPAC